MTRTPKVDYSLNMGDFRPMSLLVFLHKLVAKALTTRLAGVMGNLVSLSQPSFLKGRQLVYKVVALNEVINLAN